MVWTKGTHYQWGWTRKTIHIWPTSWSLLSPAKSTRRHLAFCILYWRQCRWTSNTFAAMAFQLGAPRIISLCWACLEIWNIMQRLVCWTEVIKMLAIEISSHAAMNAKLVIFDGHLKMCQAIQHGQKLCMPPLLGGWLLRSNTFRLKIGILGMLLGSSRRILSIYSDWGLLATLLEAPLSYSVLKACLTMKVLTALPLMLACQELGALLHCGVMPTVWLRLQFGHSPKRSCIFLRWDLFRGVVGRALIRYFCSSGSNLCLGYTVVIMLTSSFFV